MSTPAFARGPTRPLRPLIRLLLVLPVLCLALSACSVDSKKNPAWNQKCADDETLYKGFCVKDDTHSMDAGASGEPCEQDGGQRTCYEGAALETAFQLPCRVGLQTCDGKVWSACVDQVLPAEKDTCNNIDDDCDSKIDEGASGGDCVTTLKGACEQGIEYCSGGVARCRALNDPKPEMCSGTGELEEDRDCDGLAGAADPDLATPCYDSNDKGCTETADGTFVCTGICKPGMKGCSGACENAVYAMAAELPTQLVDGGMPEVLDENCNDQYDEGFECITGAYACTTIPAANRGNGTCAPGTRMCTDGGLGECENEIKPQPETCANMGEDNDCDGIEDNGIADLGKPCSTSGAKGECGSNATQQCLDGELKCVAGMASDEVCDDNRDNDCDGKIDDVCGAGGNGTCCGAACANVDESNLHCGGCNSPCAPGWSCCGGVCKNLQNDPANCASCGRDCANLLGIPLASCKKAVCSGLLGL